MTRHYRMSRVVIYKKLSDKTWDSTGIVLSDATKINVKTGIGKVKDSFSFDVNHANDRLTRTFFNGNNSTKAFTLKFYPIPSSFLGTSKFEVFVDDVLLQNTTDYSVSSSTLTFVSAPATGTSNIEVRFEVISTDDKCAIWLWEDSAWDDLSAGDKNNAFQVEGTILQPTLKSNDSGRIISVKGTGIIEIIFNALAFVKNDYVTSEKEWWEIVISTISQINKYAPPDKKIYGESEAEWDTLGNPKIKHDSSSYPKVQYSSAYKRGIEIIEELTQDKYTGDGQYYYYVKRYDADNYGFYVRYRNPTATSGQTITQGVEPIDIGATRTTEDVVNAVIYNCGFDPLERGMEFLNFNPASQSSIGSKWKYVTSTSNIGQEIINAEFAANVSNWTTTTSGTRTENFPNDYDNTPGAATYWTFQFNPRTSMGDGSYSTAAAKDVDSDNKFADIVRLESYWQGKEATDRILKLYANPKYSVKVTIHPRDPRNSDVIGDQYNIIIPSYHLHIAHPLRLMRKNTTFWDTELEFEEDASLASLN